MDLFAFLPFCTCLLFLYYLQASSRQKSRGATIDLILRHELKRYIVIRSLRRHLRTSVIGARLVPVRIASPAGSAAREELEVFHCDLELAALGTVLSGPAIVCKPAFDKNRPAFAEVLVDRLSLATERSAIDETRLLALAAILTFPFAVHSQPEIDYRRLRRQYGPGLGLVGGIPLSILRSETQEGMERSLREIVPPLMESGRYLPLAGGRVREEIPWPVYKRYREILAELIR